LRVFLKFEFFLLNINILYQITPLITPARLILSKDWLFMGNSSDWFREWFDSPYYHQLYFERDEKEATGFIDRLLSVLHPPAGSRMLDLASGRGRHSLILADKGYDVTGIDLSARSIAYARQFENDHLHFYQHDMRQTMHTHYFDYVFNFFTSFGYFRTEREHANTIRTVSLSLKEGGTFVLDYLNVPYAERHLIHRSQKKIGGVSYDLTKWSDKKTFFKKIHIEDEKGEAPLEYMEEVAKFSVGDFRALFARHRLHIQQIFGSYKLETYDELTSPRLVLIATKGRP
jgi:SAM-dependent methyltransferase